MDETIHTSDRALDAVAEALAQYRLRLGEIADALAQTVAVLEHEWPDDDGAALRMAMARTAGQLAEPAGAAAKLSERARAKAALVRQNLAFGND